jgi:DtxR family manganese transport transcriptional regulator
MSARGQGARRRGQKASGSEPAAAGGSESRRAGAQRAGQGAAPPKAPAQAAPESAQSLGIERRARLYAHVREAHASEQAEDYVEAIAELLDSGGRARVADLKRIFGVSHVTVSKTVARLVRDGLASSPRRGAIDLTPAGRNLAQRCAARHGIVLRFLRALGLDEASAQLDAEGIEHHVGPRTLELFERFAEREGG